jgi:hypothetical protein
MLHNKDVAVPVLDCHIPAIRREFRRILFFVLQNPCRPAGGGSIDRPKCGQFGANSSETCGFLPRRCKRHALATRRQGEDAFVTPPPAITGRGLCDGAALPPLARASFVQKQSPARAAGLFTCELRRV